MSVFYLKELKPKPDARAMNAEALAIRENKQDVSERDSNRNASGTGSHVVFEKNNLVIKCHSRPDELRAIENQWRHLEQVSSCGFDYFQSYDWCFNWCEQIAFAEGATGSAPEPHIFALYDQGKLVLVWPMQKVKLRSRLTILETLTDPMGQYSNILWDAGHVDTNTGRWVWKKIKETSDVDAIFVDHFPSEGFLADVLGGEGVEESVKSVSPILDYSRIESWEAYSASLGKSQRKERARKRRKLDAIGKVGFDVHFCDSEKFIELVRTSVVMKQDWLRSTNRHSQTLFDPRSSVFLENLGQTYSPSEAKNDGPMVHVLSIDGKPIATEIGLLRHGHYYSFLGAIDLDWYEYSPGKVQIEMSQKWAFENGIKKFDFLSDPSDYKSSWTNEFVDVSTRYIPVSALGGVYCSLWKARLKPFLRSRYRDSSPGFRKLVNSLLKLKS